MIQHSRPGLLIHPDTGMRSALVLFAFVISMSASTAFAAMPLNGDRLAARTGISKAAIELVASHGKRIRQLVGENEDGDEVPANGLTIDVPQERAFPTVEKLKEALGKGYIIFVSEQNFGIDGKPDQVSVLKSSDQFDALRTMSTNGWNYDLGPKAVIRKLQEWDGKYGLVIVGAGRDWLQAKFRTAPTPMRSFAEEVYKFCPDVVEQGSGSVEALASEMKETNTLYLWWD